jgi:glutamate transport system substrate-binding protein
MSRQRLWKRAICALVVGPILFGCTNTAKNSSSTLAAPVPASPTEATSRLQAIRASGKVTIGVKKDVPLFGLADPKTGELTGFDIEIAIGIVKRLFPTDANPRSRITFVEALSKDRERLLQDGVVDLVVSTYTINDARKQLVDFAGPYYIAGQDVLTKRERVESGEITGIDDVNGRKVCSVRGSTSLLNLQTAAPKADVSVLRDKYSECFDELRAGNVDAMTTDDVILLGLAQTDRRFMLTGNPFRTEPYGIGIPKGDDTLRTLVNDALQEMYDDGEWSAAFQRTVGTAGALGPLPPAIDRY